MTDKKDFSLQNQIKMRKTQEILRTIKAKKVTQAIGAVPTGAEAKAATQNPDASPKRTSQTVAIPVSSRQTQQMPALGGSRSIAAPIFSRRQRRQLIAVVATIMVMAICGVVAMTASSQPPQGNMPTYPALPTTSAQQVVAYLKDVGIHLANVTSLDSPDRP